MPRLYHPSERYLELKRTDDGGFEVSLEKPNNAGGQQWTYEHLPATDSTKFKIKNLGFNVYLDMKLSSSADSLIYDLAFPSESNVLWSQQYVNNGFYE
ncbi:hypothetical protein H0H92_008379 [Tricholoma furcatifolium]|nr:hypothetical protein H0H92_008379 [Tricholoma furcatifolium]